jgi:hypothetical protein
MNPFGSWRFTAIFGAVAVLGTAVVLSWTMANVSDLKSEPAAAAASSSEQPRDFAAAFAPLSPESTLSGSPEPTLFGWNNDLDWLSKKSMSSRAFVENKPFWQDQKADLPVPVPAPAVSRSEPASPQAKPAAPQPPVQHQATTEPQRHVAQEQRHVAQDPKLEPPHAAAAKPQPKPHRLAARPSYMEKVVEQGDAGEVTFRYRRQVCGPRHMVDVCYMPAENRRNIVVERW